jgi:multidrug resistance efflux pump
MRNIGMKSPIVVTGAVIVFAAIAGFLDGEKMRQGYTTVPVERGTVKTVIKATGVVKLSGRISDVLVNFNDVVKAGQVIARVNPEAYIAAIKKARAALKIAKATAELQRAALQKAADYPDVIEVETMSGKISVRPFWAWPPTAC